MTRRPRRSRRYARRAGCRAPRRSSAPSWISRKPGAGDPLARSHGSSALPAVSPGRVTWANGTTNIYAAPCVRRLLVDTGPLVAFANVRERRHAEALQFFSGFDGVLVSTV